MERYETFQLIDPMPEQFNSSSLSDSDDGVVLTLRSRSTEPELILEFGHTPSIRITYEECSLSSFEGNWDEPDKVVHSFIVHNSKWLSEFEEIELIHYPNPIHYVFFTINKVIEIIACKPPTVTQCLLTHPSSGTR